MTINDLEKLRKNALVKVNQGKDRTTTRIMVGMGTCGIAAGAEPVYDAIIDEINKLGVRNVSIVKVGCIGTCRLEPIVEVIKPGEEKVTYVKMTPNKARRMVASHLLVGPVMDEYTIHVVQGKILNDFTLYTD